jgi:hypothetical protein
MGQLVQSWVQIPAEVEVAGLMVLAVAELEMQVGVEVELISPAQVLQQVAEAAEGRILTERKQVCCPLEEMVHREQREVPDSEAPPSQQERVEREPVEEAAAVQALMEGLQALSLAVHQALAIAQMVAEAGVVMVVAVEGLQQTVAAAAMLAVVELGGQEEQARAVSVDLVVEAVQVSQMEAMEDLEQEEGDL